jgi:DNA-3-methyladenine glycosylase II
MIPERLSPTSLAQAANHLASRDRYLAAILESLGPPPMWSRKTGFRTLIRIILEQQVSLASAAAMFDRLESSIIPMSPERLLEMGELRLKALGLTRQKTAYFLDLADSIVQKRLNLRSLVRMGDDEVRAALMQVKGIGSWSADIYLLMALQRPDIWPGSDLALAIAISKIRRTKRRPEPAELAKIAERWRPFRSVAARMLWQYYLAQPRHVSPRLLQDG